MTCIMLLLLRILVLRLDQHRSSATTITNTTRLPRSQLSIAALPLADHRHWLNTSLGPDNNELPPGYRHVDTLLGPGERRQRSTVEKDRLPSRVKKPLIGAHQHQIYSDVDAIAGRLVRLPCFVRPLGPSDSISLVLWYRGEDISGTPIYSVDARYTPFHNAQHFVSKPYQDRQMMNFTLSKLDTEATGNSSGSSPSPTKPSSASTAHLYVMPVEESDAGLYWCRVDYKWERTTISIVTVNVIVPPRQLQIQLNADSSYCRSKVACPLVANQTITLNEDSAVTLVCSSDGGKPLPLLNWFRNDELIRNEIFHSLAPNNRSLQSELHLTQVRPTEHDIVLKCLSSNDNQTFLSSQIRLKVNSKPSRVELLPQNVSHSTVLAGSQVTFICRSFGSRPAANHTWTVVPGERHLPIAKHILLLELQAEGHAGHTQGTSDGDEVSGHKRDLPLVTESTVHLVLQPEDNGHRIVCRAENGLLRQGALEGSLKLNVTFAPKVTLQQLQIPSTNGGKSHSLASSGFAIRGSELHLHCNVTANPPVDSVVWYRNSHKLTEEDANDRQPIKIIENGTHLAVFNVTDEWQGFYQCWAKNPHGTGFSNQLQVQILYKPQCITPTQTIPANVGSLVTMICDVDANSGNVTFIWHSKHKDLHELSSRTQLGAQGQHLRIKDRGMKSRLEIRIESGDDFGQYSCWAKSIAGVQEEPCYYNVYENTIKQQLLCESNISSRAIQVQCQPESAHPSQVPTEPANRSYDVSHQTKSVLFNLKIFKHKRQLINITSIEPNFLVAVDELRQKEFDSGASQPSASREMGDVENSGDNSAMTNSSGSNELTREDQSLMYMMLISALVNGRLTSDVSLSFKVPVEPETNAIIKDKLDFDADLDLEESANYQNSQNLSTSRYKKIYPSTESHAPKDTSAASFTTAVTIKQLPLIWSMIIVILLLLILLVLTRLHFSKRRKKPQVRFSRHHQEMPASDFAGNGLSSNEYLMEDNVMVNEPGAEKESIQLFTLANFDQTYAYSEHSPSRAELSGLKHVDLRATLPDLMTGTFGFDRLPVQDYEMETSQHNLYIIHKPPQAVDTAMCQDLVSFGSAVVGAHYAGQSHADRFRTLPNLRGRTSMRIPLPLDKNSAPALKRTPSVDAIELVSWSNADEEHVHECINEQALAHLQTFPVDINSNQVP